MNRIVCDGVSSFHIDFHKNLACPKLTCQDFYYKRRLTTYAFGIFSGETKQDTVYIWPETVGPKNPDTVVSCLDYHWRTTERENRKWLNFWSDNTRYVRGFCSIWSVPIFKSIRIPYSYLHPRHQVNSYKTIGFPLPILLICVVKL